MTTIAVIGQGVKVSIGRGATPTYTLLAGTTDVGLPDTKRDEIEITSHDTPVGQKEFMGGLRDNGEVDIAMHYVPGSATDTLLTDLRGTGETVHVKFEIPTANVGVLETEVWKGFLKGYKRSPELKEAMTATATFRISTQVS